MLTIAVWFVIAAVGALVARLQLGFDLDDTIILSIATLVLARRRRDLRAALAPRRPAPAARPPHPALPRAGPLHRAVAVAAQQADAVVRRRRPARVRHGDALGLRPVQEPRDRRRRPPVRHRPALAALRAPERARRRAARHRRQTRCAPRSAASSATRPTRPRSSTTSTMRAALLAVGGGPMGAPKLPWYARAMIERAPAAISSRSTPPSSPASPAASTIGWHSAPLRPRRGRRLLSLLSRPRPVDGAPAQGAARLLPRAVRRVRRHRRVHGRAVHGADPPPRAARRRDGPRRARRSGRRRRRGRRDRPPHARARGDAPRAPRQAALDRGGQPRPRARRPDAHRRPRAQEPRARRDARQAHPRAGPARPLREARLDRSARRRHRARDQQPGQRDRQHGRPARRSGRTSIDKDPEAAEGRRARWCSVVQRGAQRTKAIVSALHNYSRTDDESVVDFDIDRSIDDSLELLRHLLKQNVTVVKNYGDRRPRARPRRSDQPGVHEPPDQRRPGARRPRQGDDHDRDPRRRRRGRGQDQRQRPGHPARRPAPHLGPVLHDQGRRRRHRPRPLDRPRARRAPRRQDRLSTRSSARARRSPSSCRARSRSPSLASAPHEAANRWIGPLRRR